MSNNALRLVTVVIGIATVVAGFVLGTHDAGAKEILVPLGMGITGWGTPHPADKVASKEE